MADIPLSPEQEAEAKVFAERLQGLVGEEVRTLARLLASKKDAELLGRTEFQLRDRLHGLGAKILEAALDERKKRGTKGRA
jgi:hypothetical protein